LCMSFTVSEREMKTFPTTILTYWHFTVHRLKTLFSQKIPPRFLYSLWRSSVKENYKSIGLPFFFFSLAKLFQYSTA
jgi:hypothetical protein